MDKAALPDFSDLRNRPGFTRAVRGLYPGRLANLAPHPQVANLARDSLGGEAAVGSLAYWRDLYAQITPSVDTA